MKNFLKRFIGFSIGPIGGAAISFFTTPLLTSFVSPVEYGRASMFTTLQALIASFIFLGMDQSYTREYQDEEDKRNLFQNALLVPLAVSVVILLVLTLFSGQVSQLMFESTEYRPTVFMFGILIVFTVLERFMLLSVRMQEKAIEYSTFNIVLKLAIFIVAALMIAVGKRDFLTVVYSTIIGQLVGDMFLLFRYRQMFNISGFRFEKTLIIQMIKFGLPLIIATSLASLLNSLDRLFLRAYGDFGQLGIYTATMKVAAVIAIVKTSFTSFWVPTAYRWFDEKKPIKHFKVISDAILLLMTFLFFFLAFFKTPITAILSSEYMDSRYILALLCLPQILYTLSETTTLGIVFSRKSYLNIWVSVISIVPSIVLNFMLTPVFGNIGAAISNAVAYFFFFTARTYFSNRTGFSFSVKKHYAVIGLMLICAILNTVDGSFVLPGSILLFVLALAVQIPTLKQFVTISQEPGEWDFN